MGDFQATQSGGPPPTTFVLKPQHADDPHAQLLFKMDPDGGMALLPNEFTTKHLDREVETFITRCAAHYTYRHMSIYALLSAVRLLCDGELHVKGLSVSLWIE